MTRSWRRPLVLVASLVLAACGGTSNQNASSTAAGSVARVSFSCRLPVAGFVPGSPKIVKLDVDGLPVQRGAGGFVSFPSGAYQAVADSDRSYFPGPGAWLPAPPQAVAPDQRSFAQPKSTSGSPYMVDRLYLIDAQTRASRLIYTAPAGDTLDVLAYGAQGVFVDLYSSVRPTQNAAASIMLDRVELINPRSGSHEPVPGTEATPNVYERWSSVTGNALWGNVTVAPKDIHSGPTMKLVQLSLRDGMLTDWYQASLSSSTGFEVLGFDADDHPILGLFPAATPGVTYLPVLQLVLLTGPNHAVPIRPEGGTFRAGPLSSFNDSHGTWFGGYDSSIWLYTPSGDFMKVATVPAQPSRPSPPTLGFEPGKVASPSPYNSLAWRTIAGPCA